MQNILTLTTDTLRVQIARRGGELWSLAYQGAERLWHGDPAWWDRRAPILFPVIGRSPGDQVEIGGTLYPMGSHGFARDLPFEVIAASPRRLVIEQRASAQTRLVYPFDYRITMSFAVEGDGLLQETAISNDGVEAMPFCFGYHPGFLWPWDGVSRREDHVCRFELAEPDPIRRARMGTGLVIAETEASPVDGRILHLSDALFTAGSLQFQTPRSRNVWFGAPGRPGLLVSFPDSPQLGIWTKPGAPYLCIEPWQGLAAEEGAPPRLARRPGALVLAPGATVSYRLGLRFGVPW